MEVDRTYSCVGSCGIWSVRFHKERYWNLHAAEKPFCFFDYEEPLVFFYLDYIAVIGLFIWIGNYACAGLRMIGRGGKSRRRGK